MSSPTLRSDTDILRAVVIAAGLCWSIAFVAVAVHYELQLYADGAMFSYAVAVQDVWAFHWHNISARMSVFFLTLWPAEAFVGLTGSPRGGIVVYGLLFYIAPLFGLIGTFAADRSRGRIISVYACCSTAVLCPLVFGFPTEMWLAHALFWPTLAVCLYASRGLAGTALILAMMAALALTHEGALVLAFGIVSTLALRGLRDGVFLRAAGVLISVLIIWIAVKLLFPPGDYFAVVLKRAALHFFDLAVFEVRIVSLLLATIAGYTFVYLVLLRFTTGNIILYAITAIVIALGVYWLWLDHSVHASNRYYLRTVLVIFTPVFGALAGFFAMRADKIVVTGPRFEQALAKLTNRDTASALIGAFLLVTLVYAVETAKFAVAWKEYRTAFATLAMSSASDPALGDPHFISSQRISTDLNRLTWFSTTPYLSVLVANLSPNRLVVDPRANYFWLSCDTATASYKALRFVPAESRNLVRIYSCLHR